MTSPLRELDHRTNHDLAVTLLWNPEGNDVILRVEQDSEQLFQTTVPQDHALDAFDHPFMYEPSTASSLDYMAY